MMQTCSNCGASIREGAKFCTSCGTRLNDSATTTTSTWEAPATGTSATPATSTSETPSWAPADSSESQSTTSTTGSTEGKDDAGFSWSWGSPSTTAQESEPSTTQVDDESGTVLDEVTTDESDPNTVTDATEVEILEDEPATTDEASADAVRSDDDTEKDDTTLADWAGQWSDEESATEPVTQSATATSQEAGDAGEDGEKEDTVAKAERLIGELRAIIPSLARPRPPVGGRSQAGPKSSEVADELESAARVGNFDDLRDTLLAVRNNPRDIDSMMSLSGKVDRLLELFDDRNNLAKTAESVASRLRGSQDEDRPNDRSSEL